MADLIVVPESEPVDNWTIWSQALHSMGQDPYPIDLRAVDFIVAYIKDLRTQEFSCAVVKHAGTKHFFYRQSRLHTWLQDHPDIPPDKVKYYKGVGLGEDFRTELLIQIVRDLLIIAKATMTGNFLTEEDIKNAARTLALAL